MSNLHVQRSDGTQDTFTPELGCEVCGGRKQKKHGTWCPRCERDAYYKRRRLVSGGALVGYQLVCRRCDAPISHGICRRCENKYEEVPHDPTATISSDGTLTVMCRGKLRRIYPQGDFDTFSYTDAEGNITQGFGPIGA